MPNIVIVGGGAGGASLAKDLSAKLPKIGPDYKLILITSRDCYVHMPAGLRLNVSPSSRLEETALIPFDNLFTNGPGTIKYGTVVSIESDGKATGGNVVLEGGEKIEYRYLVVATGSVWEGPLAALTGKKENLIDSVNVWRENFKKSKAVVIVGAGSAGLELAGELRDEYPNMEISIVHSDPLPLNSVYPDSFRIDVLKRWRKRGIFFVFDDRIIDIPEGPITTVTTQKGEKLNADVVVAVRGGKPNTELFHSLGDSVYDEKKFVKVTPTLQLPQHPDIFALGDIISFQEQKSLAKVPAQVSVVLSNITSLITGKSPKSVYKGSTEGIFITNGKNHGAGYLGILWGLKFGDTIVSMAKGKTLFVEMSHKTFGVKA
ncbi:FAD NAD(P)-binding domain-containing [Pyrrhoderma noxium]|uniref:FAD NAD(P)-binding domain-containing n=1 Tax=Pyrrhoderma noxium TaxID=2282107 RepID=A0A286URA3_9AGAM|nr:FAD NAD(P)-binding domain-containing [Pyrrhoderma noxium]